MASRELGVIVLYATEICGDMTANVGRRDNKRLKVKSSKDRLHCNGSPHNVQSLSARSGARSI
jgi:hypothetical protein